MNELESENPRMNAGVAALALGIPHEVRLKLAKRMRAEQLRRYNERVLQESSKSGHGDSTSSKQRGDSSQNQSAQRTGRRSLRAVAFQVKDMLMDAAQNGDTEEGKTLVVCRCTMQFHELCKNAL